MRKRLLCAASALVVLLLMGTFCAAAEAKAKSQVVTYVVAPCLPGFVGVPAYVTAEDHVVVRVNGDVNWVYAPSIAYVTAPVSVPIGYWSPYPYMVYPSYSCYPYGYGALPMPHPYVVGK